MDELILDLAEREFSERLLHYLNDSPTAYHAVDNAAALLEGHGFRELSEKEPWAVEAGGKYFVRKNRSGMIAFSVGSGDLAQTGMRIIAAHTDSPSFKIKPGACTVTADGYVKCSAEVYGGALLSTWFDRPLSIAGRVMVEEDGKAVEKILKLHRPLLMIPNLCIHFRRDANDKSGYNKQTELCPLLGMKREDADKGDYLPRILSGALGVDKGSILDYELFLYEYEKGCFMGEREEFISAARIDDLAMVYAGLCALTASREDAGGGRTNVLAAFDNEEVGSTTAAGANSAFLLHTIRRICSNLGLREDGYFQALANSTSISADAAHAVHPNYSDKHDPENRPVLGGGPVIKYSAAQRYATNAETAACFIQACRRAGAPYQTYVNRNDVPGGSTIGPAFSSLTTIPTVDVGTPVLAMHSIREFGSVIDNIYTRRVFQAYYDV